MTRLQGYLYNDAGTAVEGATVTALEAGTTTTIGSTDSTDANGAWQFTSGLTGKNVDVKIQSGSSIRYLKHADHVQVEHIWVRSDTAAGTPPLRVENATNSASNMVLELVGDNSTRADNDEIYISFKMDDSGGNETEFARITAEANDVTDTEEDGELRFGVMVSGTLTDVFTINSSTAGVTDMTLDVSGDLTLDADGGDVFFKDAGTTFGSATNNSGNLIIKSGTTTALTFTGSSVAIAGDLTITGDDLVMGTNTNTAILVADGTNFNPVVPSGDITLTNAGVFAFNGAIIVNADINASAAIADSKLATISTADKVSAAAVQVDGATDGTSITVATDDKMLVDDGGTTKYVNVSQIITAVGAGDITGVTAGVGLSGGGSSGGVTLTLDLSELSAVTPASGDGLATVDSDGANEQLTTVDALATLHAGDGLSASSAVMAVDLGTNPGLEISSNKLQIAKGISQHDTAQFGSGVVDDDFLRIDGTTVEGRSASEVLSDIGAGAAAGSSSIVTTGALDSGSITSGFGNIDNGSSTLDTGALDASTGTFSGVLKTDDTTNATSTTDGSLQTDGGLSVALDAIFGDDVTLITDAAVLNLGIGSDVSLTHDGTTGGTLSGTPMTIDSLGASALANDTYTGIVLGFISNEAIAIGNAVYIHTTDGRIGVADANALSTMPAIGVAVTATGSAGNAVKVLTHGIYNDSDGFGGDLTEAATMYLGETTGAVTATIPDADGDFVQVMGIACGPRDVFINPSLDIIERA